MVHAERCGTHRNLHPERIRIVQVQAYACVGVFSGLRRLAGADHPITKGLAWNCGSGAIL